MNPHPRQLSITLPVPPAALLTYVEAALALGVSVSSIRDYVARGLLAAKWLSRRAVRVPHSEVLRLKGEMEIRRQQLPAALSDADRTRRERNAASRQAASNKRDEELALAALVRGTATDRQLSLLDRVIAGGAL